MVDVYLHTLLNHLSDLRVREKVLRLAQYAALAAGPLVSVLRRDHLQRLSADISLGRFVFRLLEDLPKLRSTAALYKGRQEATIYSVRLQWLLSMLGSVCDCLYFPAEQAGWWLQDKRRAAHYKTLATKLWVLSLLCTILRSLTTMCRLKKETETRKRRQMYSQLLITLLQSGADLTNGVSMLRSPAPSKVQIGILGSISSLLGLYSLLNMKLHRT